MNMQEIITEIMDMFPELMETAEINMDIVVGAGYVPIKRRDQREPGRLKKIKVERAIRDIFVRRFKRQLQSISVTPEQKKKPKINIDLPEWEEEQFIKELISVLYTASKYGIDLFGENISIGIDYTMPNMNALKFANTYSYELIKGIDNTTRDVVSRAISEFVETPGFNIRDVLDQLEPVFGEKRASMIATTETTRAFAEGQKVAGAELRKEFPDVKIEKTWFTNNDDVVCEICGPLDGRSVPYEEEFPEGDPPAHVNCRCWTEYNTRING